jgi:GT2 family glycosyltransferase
VNGADRRVCTGAAAETIEPTPRISVVITTRDRPADLARCLPTVLANDYPDFQVLVADQSTTDATAEVVHGLADTRLVLLRLPRPGKSRALNTAFRQAQGTLLALTDDDCTVPADWLSRGATTLCQEPRPALICGALLAIEFDVATELVPSFFPARYRRLRGIPLVPFRYIGKHQFWGPGANMFVWREDLKRLGGSDEWLGPGAPLRNVDDGDLVYRALRAGFTIAHAPDVTVLHWGKRAGPNVKHLLASYAYGHGAFYMRNFRRGDRMAAYLLLQEVLWRGGHTLWNLVRGRRLLWPRYIANMALGAMAALKYPTTLEWSDTGSIDSGADRRIVKSGG